MPEITIKTADLPGETLQHLRNTIVAGIPLVGPEDEEITLTSDDITEAIGHCSSNSFMLPLLRPNKPPAEPVLHYVRELSDFEEILERDKNATVVRKESNQPASYEQTSTTQVAQAEESQAGSVDSSKVQAQTIPENNDPTVVDLQKGWLQFEWDETQDKLMPVIPPNTTVIIETGPGGERFITFANTNEPVGRDIGAFIDSQNASSKTLDYPVEDGKGYPRYSFNRKYLYGYKDGALIVLYKSPQLLRFEFAEHMKLGNDLQLRWSDTQVFQATQQKLKLNSKLQLTYGEINGLAGDFYGTKQPICKGETFEEQLKRFEAAYKTLAGDTVTVPNEVKSILQNRQAEVKALEDAIKTPGASTAQAYEELAAKSRKMIVTLPDWVPVDDLILNLQTTSRKDTPTYLELSRLNFDHFGADAHTAYNAGHFCAMRAAASGDLNLGYAMNAFADHFLGDLFAAGHMRTPRRLLHYDEKPGISPGFWDKLTPFIDLLPDYCAGMMHAEDNKNGLRVSNAKDSWTAYGDKFLFEKDNTKNREHMRDALQASIDEVWLSYSKKKIAVEDPAAFKAWEHAPTIKSAMEGQDTYPFFKPDKDGGLLVRDDWNNAKVNKYTKYTSWTSLSQHFAWLKVKNAVGWS